jgi:hypothetical protein
VSALAEIEAAITAAKATPDLNPGPFKISRRWKVRVGHSAAQAICCEAEERRLPTMIDDCVVERTGDFPGWELVRI